jgi:uncharacterized sulfatase
MQIRIQVRYIFLLFLFFIGCKQIPDGKKTMESSERPNILFAISDDQSFIHTSFAGCDFVKTPAFDRIAAEGIYFQNCYAGSPGCAPSRSSLVTGRHHWQNEQAGQHGSAWLKKYVPFIDEIRDNGYYIGRAGKGVGPFKYAENSNDTLLREENAAGPWRSYIKYEEKDDERFATGINQVNYFENFRFFLENNEKNAPFFFWYGGHEPHRGYEKGSWKNAGKKLKDVEVPEFLPDNDVIRGDLLDYAVEIEWFDLHLQRMLEHLDDIGELDNTIVIVTSDNGMPFPRAKANSYEYGVHVPFAVRFPPQFPGNRIVKDPIGFADIAPTILEITRTKPNDMMPITGESFLHLLKSTKSGYVTEKERPVFSGRERHSSSRYQNWGYPQRAVRKGDYLFIWNMTPERWPAGAPRKYDRTDTTQLLSMYNLNEKGEYFTGGVFADIDGSPSKTFLIEHHAEQNVKPFFEMAVNRRPDYELYNVSSDPGCIHNLADDPAFSDLKNELKELLYNELKVTHDPRVTGPDHDIFDSYKRYMHIRKFPKPERVK